MTENVGVDILNPSNDTAPTGEPPALPGIAEARRRLPWDLHSSLTEDRLRTCARLLANARRDALAMASHELGDDAWSVGCRAYAFSRHRLQRAAEAGDHPWLKVLDGSHHFVFLIDRVPVRFYRGAADDPTDRTMRRQAIEAQQLTLALGDSQAVDEGLVFRLAVETGEAGRVERVVFVVLRGEADAVECFWPVPLEIEVAGLPRSATDGPVQLRLIADDGYEGPSPAGRRGREGSSPPLPRRRIA